MRRLLICVTLVAGTACSEFDLQSHQVGPDAPVDEPVDDLVQDPVEDPADLPVDDPADDEGTDEPPVQDDPPPPGEPVADAGADVLIDPLDWHTLDAIASYDPGGYEPLSYRWSVTSKPTESGLFIFNKTKRNPRLWFDVAGDYTFQLEVMNSAGIWDSTPDLVTVTAEPSDRFYVQLSWDADSDLDLHVLATPSVPIFDTPGDCAYCNTNPSWGTPSALDDPSLDWDDVDGQGPETTTIEDPSAGDYKILVHYYGQNGDFQCIDWDCPISQAKVDFWIDGVLVHTETGTLVDQGDVWEVGTLHWPSATITPSGTMDYTPLTGCN